MNSKNKKIKVAIIGAGAITDSHAYSWNKSGSAEVIAVMNHHINKAIEKAKKWNIPGRAYDSISELIKSQKPDLIDICTPEHVHAEPAINILDENIPVFCEKIMASSLKDGFKMIEKAREKKIWAGMCYNYHFLPSIRLLREIIKSGKEGKIKVLSMNTHAFCFHHILQVVLWINGLPDRVVANGVSREWPKELSEKYRIGKDLIYFPDKFSGRMEYEGGLFVNITSSFTSEFTAEVSKFPFQIIAIFENGKVFEITGLDWWNDMVGIARWLPDKQNEMDKYSNKEEKGNDISFYKYLKDTAEKFISGLDAESTWEDGWDVMVVDHALLISGQKGTYVDVKALKVKLEQNKGIIT